jgi:hypothetical protein
MIFLWCAIDIRAPPDSGLIFQMTPAARACRSSSFLDAKNLHPATTSTGLTEESRPTDKVREHVLSVERWRCWLKVEVSHAYSPARFVEVLVVFSADF